VQGDFNQHESGGSPRLSASGRAGGSSFLHALDAFRKKTKSLQADRLVVYQNTYSLALCLAPNLLDEGLESRPTLLAELLFETKRYKLV
jgi:hypothetical protein